MAQRLQAFLSMGHRQRPWTGGIPLPGTPIFCPGAATLGTPGDPRTPPRRISPPRTAPAPDADYAADQNLLYQVFGPENELLYSNVPAGAEITSGRELPEGYNFHLVFRHGEVQIRKDGEPVDVYGDGFYTEDALWDVPGYENFTAGEDVAGVTVYMAVRQEPVPYVQLSTDGGARFYNGLYDTYQYIREMQGFYVLRAVLCVLGIACLAVARLLRTDRRRAEARLAALTRHVPGEVWWLAAILLLTMVFSMDPYTGYSPFELWYYGWMDSSLTDVLRLLALLPANAAALLVLVWVLWLRRITRKNAEPDQRWSLLGALKNMLLAKELKLPVQKRLRRCAAVGIFSLILIPIGASPAILSILDRVFYDGYALSLYFLLFLFLLLYVLLFCWTISSYRRITRTARDIGLLADQVTAIRDGDLETPLDLPADADLRQTAEQLNDIQAGLHRALAEQTRSERMKVELISNVSPRPEDAADLRALLRGAAAAGAPGGGRGGLRPDHRREGPPAGGDGPGRV